MGTLLTQIVYRYDGSFDGFLCCVFAAIADKQQPIAILTHDNPQLSLTPERTIVTEPVKAGRVFRSLSVKLSLEAQQFVQEAFTCQLEQKELLLLAFLRKGYREGNGVLYQLAEEPTSTLFKAVKHLHNEIHHFHMFVRFADYEGILAAKIKPKNNLLSQMAPHFATRFPKEHLFIYDETYHQAYFYRPYESVVVPMESFLFDEESDEELEFQALWKKFYDTVAIEQRIDLKARRNHMPKRFWSNIVEVR